jgi:O-glycosyl hydrolase
MLPKTKCFLAVAAFALALAFAFTACEDLYSELSASASAEEPTITKQPEDLSFIMGGADKKLTVTAEVRDGGSLSYQWYTANAAQYKNGEGNAIPDANDKTYTIGLGEGVWQVYVIVTNTIGDGKSASIKSNLVRVTINDPANAEYPALADVFNVIGYPWPTGTMIPISVPATVNSGVLSWQWYSSDTYSNENGTLITGATNEEYTPTIAAKDTFYYFYVIITNTDSAKTGIKAKSVTSSPIAVKAVEPNSTITVSSTANQFVRGFGVMAPFWSNAPQDRVSDYETMFNPKKLGYNMLRVMIPVDADGGSTEMREIMNKALNNQLSGAKDRTHYYEIVKVANKYNGYVLASPWSPPAAWKTNNSVNGSGAGDKAVLLTRYYRSYAAYLKEYCQIMLENGAPVYAVSIQNEPNFEADYDGCEWTGGEMRDFFLLVKRFTEGVEGFGGGKKIPTVLTMFGESANSPTASEYGFKDPTASQYIDLYARHIYGSPRVTISAQVQAQGKEVWMTEYNINSQNEASYPNDSTYNQMWKFINCIDLVIRMNKENAFIWWYGVRFYSMVGDGEYGTVIGAPLPRGWALSHYAKFANETRQVELSFSGTDASGVAMTAGSNFNNTSYDLVSTAVRATAFMSTDASGNMTNDSLSLVLFTPTTDSGGGGRNMGNIRINFPLGFTATKVEAMRSKSESLGYADEDTVLLSDGTGAFVNLPAGQILSVKFTK